MQRSRKVLAQRPPPTPRPIQRSGIRTALLVFTRQVLLRPTRIGTLALFGGMIAVALVGAEDWWIVLGISLFQVAACSLTAMWVDTPRTGPLRRATPPRSWVVPPPESWVVNGVPRQRQPRPDE